MTNEEHIEELAKKLAGNFLKFECFAMSNKPKNPEKWCIVYTHNRDSGIMERSNARVIHRLLETYLNDDCQVFEANHWACGWVSGYLMLIWDADGNITPWFKEYAEAVIAMEDYPILDEMDHSELENEDANQTWSNCYNDQERLYHLRYYWDDYQDAFRSIGDLLSCARGEFAPMGNCGFERLNLIY